MVSPVYALPPPPHARLGGHEVSIELRTPSDAAPYLPHRHRPHASIDSRRCSGDLSEIIEAQQPIRCIVTSQAGSHPPKQRSSAGIGEVPLYLLFPVWVSHHR